MYNHETNSKKPVVLIVMVNQVKESNSQNSARDNKIKDLQMPTLDQFMDLITNENKSVTATPSGYNVYNKYHKSS